MVEALSHNALGFTVKVAGKTIGNLTLDEVEKILAIPLPIATVVEEKGEYFPVVVMGSREFTGAGYRSWRGADKASVEIADRVLQTEIDRILGV